MPIKKAIEEALRESLMPDLAALKQTFADKKSVMYGTDNASILTLLKSGWKTLMLI